MLQNFILFLFAGGILGIIAYILYNQLIKYLKGTIHLELPKKAYFYGDNLDVLLKFHAKKDIAVQKIELNLIAYKREYAQGTKSNAFRSVELFRQTQVIEEKTQYKAETRKEFGTSVKIPQVDELDLSLQEQIHVKNKINKDFQKHSYSNYKQGKLRWKIRVNMMCEGLDLTSSEGLRLSEKTEGI